MNRIDHMIAYPLTVARAGRSLAVVADGSAPAWRYTRWELEAQKLQGVSVRASQYPVTLQLYRDGATGPSKRVAITSASDVALSDGEVWRSVEFDFDGDDARVERVELHFQAPQEPSNGRVSWRGPFWRNLEFRYAEASAPSCARVVAELYTSCTVSFYVDGSTSAAATVTVDDDGWFLLPRGLTEGRLWSVDVETDGVVHRVDVQARVRKPVWRGGIRLGRSAAEMPYWFGRRYQFEQEETLVSMRVDANRYPVTAQLYVDGATAATQTVTFDDAREVALDAAVAGEVAVDFAGDDGQVTQAHLFAETRVPLSGPFTLRGDNGLLKYRFDFADVGQIAGVSVSARDYTNLAVRLTSDAGDVQGAHPQDGEPVLFTQTNDAHSWRLEVLPGAGAVVHTVTVYPVILREAGSVVHWSTARDGTTPWYTWWHWPETVRLRSLRGATYHGDVKSVRVVDVVSGDSRLVAVSGAEEGFGEALEAQTVRLETDPKVSNMTLYAEDAVPVSGAGYVARGAPVGAAWRNKTLQFAELGSFDVARVVATEYPVTLRLRAQGGSWQEWTVADAAEFVLRGFTAAPSLPVAASFDMEIVGYGHVREVHLLAREDRVFDGRLVMRREEGAWSWLCKRWRAPRPVAPGCARVVSDLYPVQLDVWTRDVLVAQVLAHDARAFRLPRLPQDAHWRVDAYSEGEKAIREVAVATSMAGLRG